MLRLSARALLASLLVLLVALNSQAGAAPHIERVILESQVLGEDRPLNIALPDEFSPEKTYPVVYALDGGAKYLPSVAEQMLAAHPDLIVVGVENVDRSRDMFPEPLPDRDNRGGGGAAFLAFLTGELVPFIEEKYPTSGYQVLAGQSNSGFFVLYAMLNDARVFDAYLSISPMIGWDWDLIRDGSTDLLRGRKSFPRVLYLNRGETDYDHTTNFLPRYVELLAEIAPRDFRWTHEVAKGQGHVPDGSFGNGIAFIFGTR